MVKTHEKQVFFSPGIIKTADTMTTKNECRTRLYIGGCRDLLSPNTLLQISVEGWTADKWQKEHECDWYIIFGVTKQANKKSSFAFDACFNELKKKNIAKSFVGLQKAVFAINRIKSN